MIETSSPVSQLRDEFGEKQALFGTQPAIIQRFIEAQARQIADALIEQALDTGSAASHRGYKPTKEVIDYVMNVIELLLHQEILSAQTSSIKSVVPQRNK